MGNNNSISKRWKEVCGQDKWQNMLDPLNIDLRRYIINCGKMAQATCDAFNSEKASKFAGSSQYGRSDFFWMVGLQDLNKRYKVTKFIYATSSLDLPDVFMVKSLSRETWSKESNWIGYVAVATNEGKKVMGRREIVIVWRGTGEPLEWADDFNFMLVSVSPLLGLSSGEAKVHQGWYSMYTSDDPRSHFNKTSARNQVLGEVKRLMKQYKKEAISITVTGHSLGAALATLNATDIVANGVNNTKRKHDQACLVTAIVFGSPRVGDANFRQFFTELDNLQALRIRNAPDIVPNFPPIGYCEVGQELLIDTRESNYLKSPGSFATWHDIEGYLLGVAGTQGTKGRFKLEVDFDIAMVNKYSDALKDEYLVPASWRVQKNKGMVQVANGYWKFIEKEMVDFGL
ncbi:hypothetical protein NE237_032021 [Protea cynaroides]|uniref:Phospholipase A1 n=1 Tax=Protea cynaroides TaxID=273540 RepID=A0A9Q0L2I4_9MAGN|nr:hypothetical protein NE237_032021 [Protea cynaroides]